MSKSALFSAVLAAFSLLGLSATVAQQPAEPVTKTVHVPDAGFPLRRNTIPPKPKSWRTPAHPTTRAKAANLLKAAEHLKQAGEQELANHVRTKAEKTTKMALIAGKLREIKKLQDEVAALQRQMAAGQQVILHVQVLEFSIDKLRKAGVDGDALVKLLLSDENSDDKRIPKTGEETAEKQNQPTQMTSLQGKPIQQLVESLRKQGLVRILAEPTLVTVSGRPVTFRSGGEFPLLVPQSLGTVSVEYRNIGTRIDCTPLVLGDGRLRLELRPEITVVDDQHSIDLNGRKIPGLRTRMIDTAIEIEVGQTTYIGGLVQDRSTDRDPMKTEHTAFVIGVRPEWPKPLTAKLRTPHTQR